jgi:hypothetical protein
MRQKSETCRGDENGLTRLIEVVDVQLRRFSSPLRTLQFDMNYHHLELDARTLNLV